MSSINQMPIEETNTKVENLINTANKCLKIIYTEYTLEEINEVCTLLQFMVDKTMRVIGQRFSDEVEMKARQLFAENLLEDFTEPNKETLN